MSKPTLNYYAKVVNIPFGTSGLPQAYYATKRSYGNIGVTELIQRISENSQVNRGAVYAITEAIFNNVENFVLNGHTVQLGDFLNLRVAFKANKEKNTQVAANVSADDVERVRVVASFGSAVRSLQDPANYNFVYTGTPRT